MPDLGEFKGVARALMFWNASAWRPWEEISLDFAQQAARWDEAEKALAEAKAAADA